MTSRPQNDHPALSFYQPLEGATRRLVCFSHAGGGASAFRAIREELAPHGVEVCPLQLPGRENRISEQLLRRASVIVDHLDEALDQLPPLPSTFLGHSMGSLIAYLLALKWQQNGKPAPERLIASAGPSPTSRTEPRNMYTLPNAEFKRRIFEHGGVPEQLRQMPEMLEIFIPILRADYGVLDRYVYQEAELLTCPVIVYGGVEDEAVTVDKLPRWSEISAHDVVVREFDGGHFYLYQNFDTVKEQLLQDIG